MNPDHDTPPPPTIPLAVPALGGAEWTYLKECLDTNWVSSVGPFVSRFEHLMASLVGVRAAVATVTGTAALHIALLIAGVEPEDEVLVSALTFIAPANAIRYVGAWPVFVDAEPRYWQMDPDKLKEWLGYECAWREGALRNTRTGRRVRAILPVHILGHPCDMAPIVALARRYELVVIEDASESMGATYQGRPVGSLSDVACFSFNGNKVVTSGGGGMLVTDRAAWAERARYLTTQAKDDPLSHVHGAVGYNYRLTNLQAAVGCAQLERLEQHVAAKRRIARAYAEAFAEVPGLVPMPEAAWASSSFWMYTVLVDEAVTGLSNRALMRSLGAAGIETRPLWQPLHRSPAHRHAPRVECPVADWLHQQALSLPSSVGLRAEEQQRVIEAVLATTRSLARETL